MKEKWDIYNAQRQLTHETIYRGDKLALNQYHLVVHVCYFNHQKQMLIQQRSSHKTWGGLWDISIGGAVQSGESSQMAAQRESFEELGIIQDFKHMRPQVSRTFERGFDDIYLIKRDMDIKDITFNDHEACQATWASRDEVVSLIKNGKFLPIHEIEFIDFLFKIAYK